jgi:hypothetical protein
MKPRRPSVKDMFGAHRRQRTKRLAKAKEEAETKAKKTAKRDDLDEIAARIVKNVEKRTIREETNQASGTA